MIQRQFAGAERARALGVYAATLASGAVVGQALGGLLVSADLLGASWRPVFLVNVPVGLAAAPAGPRLVPADQVPGGRRLDLPGLLTTTIQLSQVIGVAVFGSLFLSLAAQPRARLGGRVLRRRGVAGRPHPAGVVGVLLLARTVRAATRTAPTG